MSSSSYEAQVRAMAGGRPVIDLRSDTVTHPTPAMREAMARAEVGDDVYGEDPTINRLEELAAEMTGKEAALFTASGTMGNAIAILTHCRRGEEVIAGDRSHVALDEVSGAARLNGSQVRAVPNLPDGTLDRAKLERAFRGDDIHEARTGLLCLEDTHNMCGGRVLSAAILHELAAHARRRGVPVHLDGARLFNAAVALGVPASTLAAEADSVQFCLSKGLSAPVGSMLVGSRDFIGEARRNRKLLGGGMRQAGVLAAAGILALAEMVERLAEDHANARTLAVGLDTLPGLALQPDTVESNMVFFDVRPRDGTTENAAFTRALAREGVLVSGGDDGRIRAVTHYGITADDITRVLAAAEAALKAPVA